MILADALAEAGQINIHITINGLYGKYEQINECFYLIGNVYFQQELLTCKQCYHLLKSALLADDLKHFLEKLSGFYSVVWLEDGRLITAVDKVRSRPLFYAIEGGALYLSDTASWVVEQLVNTRFDELSAQELLQAGYVTGNNTLVEQLKQIPASCYLTFDKRGALCDRYYQFSPLNSNKDNDKSAELFERLDNVMKESINQLIDYANGRQLVIPLSGGYDSRAIAIYIKEAGYQNVVTFTFGKVSSQEVVISNKVAKALGFKWLCIEYNKNKWRAISKSSLFNRYLGFISHFVSVPNIQVYPAIKQLYDDRLIDENAIIVPGHTGDFISGGHIPQSLIGLTAVGNEDKIVESILTRHYKNKSKSNRDDELKAKLFQQINLMIKSLPTDIPAISVFESWEFSERQAKYIVNSNRYYDFFKLEWWMPLWHDAMVAYWETVPVKYRLNSTYWRYFVEQKYQEISGDSSKYGNVRDQYSPKLLRLRAMFDYFTDENDLYALVPFYRWLLRKVGYPYANGTLRSYLSAKVVNRYKKMLKNFNTT